MLHSIMVEMTVAIPIIAIAGILLGYLVKRNALLFGCVAVLAYFACHIIYCSIITGQFTFSHDVGYISYTFASIAAWFFLFIMMTRIGVFKFKKIQKD